LEGEGLYRSVSDGSKCRTQRIAEKDPVSTSLASSATIDDVMIKLLIHLFLDIRVKPKVYNTHATVHVALHDPKATSSFPFQPDPRPRHLDNVLEIRIPVVSAPPEALHLPGGLAPVEMVQIQAFQEDQYPCRTEHAHDDGVCLFVDGRLVRLVDEGSWEASAVGHGELKPDGRRARIVVGVVAREPYEDWRDGRVEARSDEEEGAVFGVQVARVGDNGVACDREREEAEHDRPAHLVPVRDVRGDHRKECGDGVGRYREELGADSSVA
jgi:hypothetical protein